MGRIWFVALLLVGCGGASEMRGDRPASYAEADARARACLERSGGHTGACSEEIADRNAASDRERVLAPSSPPPAPEATPPAPTGSVAAAPDPNAAHAADCASDRAARIAHMRQRIAAVDEVYALQEWENTHCKWIDDGKMVVRTYQDSRGFLYQREENERAPERRCDAKLPPRLAHSYAEHLPVSFLLEPDEGRRDAVCADADVSDPTAAKFWAEWTYHKPYTRPE